MKTLVSCITLGLIVWSTSAQQIQPYPNYSGSGQSQSGGNLHVLPYGTQPANRPTARPSTGYSIAPYQNQSQYPYTRQPNYNNRFPNQQGQNYNTGGYWNYGNNRKYGNNSRFPTQTSQYGNNGRFPSQTGQTTRNYGNSSARVVVPWWFTGQFNTALPHIRQQRPTQNGYGNNYNQGRNQFPQNQYGNQSGNGYGNQNGNYGRPQTGYQNGYQRPTYGSGYNNPYNTGQRYRTMPSQVGIGVQPRVLR
jgi:hypothetical protein